MRPGGRALLRPNFNAEDRHSRAGGRTDEEFEAQKRRVLGLAVPGPASAGGAREEVLGGQVGSLGGGNGVGTIPDRSNPKSGDGKIGSGDSGATKPSRVGEILPDEPGTPGADGGGI